MIDTAADRYEEVRAGYARGWSFEPTRGKEGFRTGWNTRPRETLDEAEQWAVEGNIALRTGAASGVVVVDVDTPQMPAELAAIRTPTVRTGSGKWHLYCRRPPEGIGCKQNLNGIGFDIRGDGGLATFPGSVHPETGAAYTWTVHPDDCPLADLPQWIIDAAKPKPIPVSAPHTPPDERVHKRAAAYLDAMEPAISGAGGHIATLKAASAMAWSFDLGPDEALRLLIERYNPRCQPPRSEQELRHKVAEAMKGGCGKPRGHLRDQPLPDQKSQRRRAAAASRAAWKRQLENA